MEIFLEANTFTLLTTWVVFLTGRVGMAVPTKALFSMMAAMTAGWGIEGGAKGR